MNDKAYIKAEPKGDDVNISYDGDIKSLIILINLVINTIAMDMKLSYDTFAEILLDEGKEMVKFLKDKGVEVEINNTQKDTEGEK